MKNFPNRHIQGIKQIISIRLLLRLINEQLNQYLFIYIPNSPSPSKLTRKMATKFDRIRSIVLIGFFVV